MPSSMSKSPRNPFLSIFGLLLAPQLIAAQAIFNIPPDSITDYTSYDRIETCNAMARRVSKQVSNRKDSIAYKSRVFLTAPVDTTKSILRWSVGECMNKFDVETIAQHDFISKGKHSILSDAMQLYYQGRHFNRFFSLVDSVLKDAENADTVWKDMVVAFKMIEKSIEEVQPVNFKLMDSLQDKHVVPALLANREDLAAYEAYVRVLLDRVDRKYKNSRRAGAGEYQSLASMIDREVGARIRTDSSRSAHQIRLLLRSVYDKLHHFAILDSLKLGGPDGYFKALRANHKLAGFKNERSFFGLGVTQKFFTPLAFRVYRYDGEVWEAGSVKNIEYDLLQRGKPQIVMSMEALCRNETFHRSPRAWQRGIRTFECWDRYELIKWLKQQYPEIEVTIITSTRGHITEIALKDPSQEAELIKDSWWGYHKLPANILIYHTNYFNMGGLDRRRQDLLNENFQMYIDIPGVSPEVKYIHATLIGPDGRIITTLGLSYGAIKSAKEKLDAFYSWYQTRHEQQSEHR